MLPLVYEDIGFSLGVKTLAQMVGVSATRGFIPILHERHNLQLSDSQKFILNSIIIGSQSGDIMRQMPIVTVTTFRDLRADAFRAIGAQTNPAVVRQMYALGLAR